jgi:hypothetical protein
MAASPAKDSALHYLSRLRDLTANDKYWFAAVDAHLEALKVRVLQMLSIATLEDECSALNKTSDAIVQERLAYFHVPPHMISGQSGNANLNLAADKVRALETELSGMFRHVFEELYLRSQQAALRDAERREYTIETIENRFLLQQERVHRTNLEHRLAQERDTVAHLQFKLHNKEHEVSQLRAEILKQNVHNAVKDGGGTATLPSLQNGDWSTGKKEKQLNGKDTPEPAPRPLHPVFVSKRERGTQLDEEDVQGGSQPVRKQSMPISVELLKARALVSQLQQDLEAQRIAYAEVLRGSQSARKESQEKIDALETKLRQWGAYLGGLDLNASPPSANRPIFGHAANSATAVAADLLTQVQDWQRKHDLCQVQLRQVQHEASAARDMVEILQKKLMMTETKNQRMARQVVRLDSLSRSQTPSPRDKVSGIFIQVSPSEDDFVSLPLVQKDPATDDARPRSEEDFWMWMTDTRTSATRQYAEKDLGNMFTVRQRKLLHIATFVCDAAIALKKALADAQQDKAVALSSLHTICWKLQRQCERDDDDIIRSTEAGKKAGPSVLEDGDKAKRNLKRIGSMALSLSSLKNSAADGRS